MHEPWRQRAACWGYPESLFYGYEDDLAQREPNSVRRAREAAAAALCARCPVQQECLASELRMDIGEQHGFAGGHTADQRIAMVRAARKAQEQQQQQESP